MVSFAVQKLIILIRSHLLIFVFISIALETDLRNHCYDLCQRIVCLCSLLGLLLCPVLTFKSLSHFEFIFVHSAKVLTSLIYMWLLTFPAPPAERLYFSPGVNIFLSSLLKTIDCRCVGLFLGSPFCSIDPHVSFCVNTTFF